MRPAYDEIVNVAEVVRGSETDWTLVRVTMLNNNPASGEHPGWPPGQEPDRDEDLSVGPGRIPAGAGAGQGIRATSARGQQLTPVKVTILSYGSRGDIQPFVALAVGLRRSGHDVRLAAPHRFVDLLSQYQIPFAPLPGDPEEMSAFVNAAALPFSETNRRGILRPDGIGAVCGMARYVWGIAGPVCGRRSTPARMPTSSCTHSSSRPLRTPWPANATFPMSPCSSSRCSCRRAPTRWSPYQAFGRAR